MEHGGNVRYVQEFSLLKVVFGLMHVFIQERNHISASFVNVSSHRHQHFEVTSVYTQEKDHTSALTAVNHSHSLQDLGLITKPTSLDKVKDECNTLSPQSRS